MTPLTREKPAPLPYRTKGLVKVPGDQGQDLDKKTDQQDTERKTGHWRTSNNVPPCFHCERPGHLTRYCRKR
ncbi:hypothetical protein TNIN_166521 [Trichonephila inaurata madagascariensis]|uniref:CCHC-type domain-containing protein n=1 Tax=Trichonephila inaurata madagascariensis TaxID=2747483 RepID=A0A8X7CBC7_9ARAC|nr:hypothetical protein TNIN_166521 [Trichonephila inaurata madagascariensis]